MADNAFEFADFRLDCDRFELRRAGRSLKLERKPMELLILLAARDGHLVTRDEIAERLWDREVFVDTEHGINTAIRKIRQVLRDDPEQPRFVETVTGKGYRFIGTVKEVAPPLSELASTENGHAEFRGAASALAPRSVLPIDAPPANNSDLPRNQTALDSSSPRLRSWFPVLATAAAIAILLVSIGAWRAHRAAGPPISSLAVIPLDNLSGDPGQDYFADGMTDELITMLAKNSTLRIISRTSVMQYKGVHRPLPEIARELGVDGILEGSVSRSGDKMHMTIQLIRASNDAHVWAESYDRDANDVVSLPREAAQTIAKKLNSAVPPTAPARYVNPEAHDAYLHGKYLWFLGKNNEARKYFTKATELQPDYALGWSGLSDYYGQGVLTDLDPRDALAQEETTARKAVELDDSLPEAHLTLGASMFIDQWNWARAEQELARAIELNPGFAEAYHFHSKVLSVLNRKEEAIESEKKAMELDPFQRPWALALVYVETRQYDAALNEGFQKLQSNPQDRGFLWQIYSAYRCQGNGKEAAETLEKIYLSKGDPASVATAATIRRDFEQGGYPAVVRWQLAQLKERASTRYVSPVDFADLNAQLGRREETLSLLEEGYRQHSPQLLWIQTDPAFDFLHTDERYRSIIRRIGLPPTY